MKLKINYGVEIGKGKHFTLTHPHMQIINYYYSWEIAPVRRWFKKMCAYAKKKAKVALSCLSPRNNNYSNNHNNTANRKNQG